MILRLLIKNLCKDSNFGLHSPPYPSFKKKKGRRGLHRQFKSISLVDIEFPESSGMQFILCIGLSLIIKMDRDRDTSFFL